LHDVHKMNAYRADHVCLSICPHDSAQQPMGWFWWNFVWTLCHWRLPDTCTFL